MTDITGRIVYTGTLESQTKSFDLKGLQLGMYLLNFNDEEQSSVKILIN